LRDTNAVIFVYCRSGNRSVTAADILVNLGYKKVYNLGGIINWPYEVVK
ncbi:MAG: rhodanese-like domain-containing protein, partial [Clostridiaceae bacterium]